MARGEVTGLADATDEDLLRRVGRRDRAAFEELYHRHRDRLLAVSLRLLGDWDAAEEALQDALVKVWRQAASYQGRSTARTWLHAVTRNSALNGARRRALPVDDGADLADLPGAETGPEQAALARADKAELDAALAQLPAAHREVLTLAYVGELTHAEIADVLGVPVGTVKSRAHAARRGLAATLRAREAQPRQAPPREAQPRQAQPREAPPRAGLSRTAPPREPRQEEMTR